MEENRYCSEVNENEAEEISIIDILLIIAESKKLILLTALLFALAGFGYTYASNVKKSETVLAEAKAASTMQILPITTQTLKIGYFYPQSSTFVNSIIKSNIVLDKILEDNGLLKDKASQVEARKELLDRITTKVDDKTGIITVETRADSAEHSLAIANSLFNGVSETLDDMWKKVDTKGVARLKERFQASAGQTGKQQENINDDSGIMAVYLVSPIENIENISADRIIAPAQRSKSKIVILSILLGLFVGVTGAFVKYFWRASAPDPVTKEKITRLKELMGLKK